MKNQTWKITPDKYLQQDEVKQLFASTENLSIIDKAKGREKCQKAWMLIDLCFNTGLRVAEIRDIRLEDLTLSGSEPRLFVRNGKGGKQRYVPLGNTKLRQHIKEYISFMENIGQSTEPDAHLFQSRKSPRYSRMGLQHLFNEALKASGIKGHSIHHSRHSFAVHHYQKNKDLRGLQILLGHSSPTTTTVYCDRPFSELVTSTENIY